MEKILEFKQEKPVSFERSQEGKEALDAFKSYVRTLNITLSQADQLYTLLKNFVDITQNDCFDEGAAMTLAEIERTAEALEEEPHLLN